MNNINTISFKRLAINLLAILTVALVFLPVSHAKSAPYSSIEDFLQKQRLIRVCISNGPGFGDQASAFNVMSHLRQLGYQGNFEVIYDKWVMNAVSTVFNLPATIPEVYTDEINHIKFIEKNTYSKLFDNHQIERVDFGFNLGKSQLACEIEDANTNTFADFMPYFGNTNDETLITTLTQDQERPTEIWQDGSARKYFIIPVPSYEETKQFLQNDPKGKALSLQKPALKTFLNGIDNQLYNVIFIYGYTVKLDTAGHYNLPIMASNILQTIAGARYAQLMGPADLKKPIVIAVFYNYINDAKTILQLIHSKHWGDLEIAGAVDARAAIHQLKLEESVSIADIEDPATITTLQTVKPGQILLLSMGTMPKNVFDGIYNYTADNILPQVHEGAGTFSTLMQTGRPHFECAARSGVFANDTERYEWTPGFDLVSDPLLKVTLQQLYNQQAGYCGLIISDDGQHEQYDFSLPWKQRTYQTLGQLIIDTKDKNSAFSKYFVDLQRDVQNPENDRVRYALEEVVKQLNKMQ
ncbi:MAG: hypothetical protein A3F11_07310 [Gammaproteobacteria bacterium RIFCSPHIGHO2_12_FULL_37_14]|nr:MAG: hypothetical protein A3F11_07310 [Gammaproteobacteria bacterium RIFCSPHIGHO2_12_FULL_37_14]